MTDEAFLSIKLGKYSVKLLNLMMGTVLVGVGYYASKKFYSTNIEGACPVDHTLRNEMIKHAK